ncbi:hypothetical protein NP493_750g00024 [Ridgeia piscesae]|uniref:TIR domain-containing protein n=1 Tax=Ridgeia piscesae TaxID=27915 RepID=A0AAD9KPS9_RIDPI|nr:hypothetical protein NP493_750g00024 [Ridgeia piscesae]
MKKNVDIVSRGVGVYLTLSGCIAASLTFPCHITKDTFWDEGDTVNCSYRHLTQVPRDIPAGTTTLLLNNNDISQLGPTDFNNLTELRHLDLSTNVLQSNQIAPDAFVALGSLLYLDLSYNSLCMSNECFPKSLYGPLRLLKVFKATRKYAIADPRGIVEYPFRSLSVLEVLRELHVSGIPNVAIPSDIALLKKLQVLDLYLGRLSNISAATFRALHGSNIMTLSLRDNGISQVELGQFSLNLSRLRSLQWLNLSGNEMSALSEDLRHSLDELSERVNFSLDISGNPLSCTSCASLPFLCWLRATRVRIVAKDMLTCAENHNLRVVSISLEDLEASCASAAPGPSLLSVAGSVGFCTLSMVFFLYVNRWRMRWYYYSIKRHLRQKDGSTQDTNHYRYDACVVYADADLNWVAHELIEQVETDWALSLFVYDRDSQAGFPIAENIVQSLETSRYVLFVVTPDFCDDKWCDFALNMALLRDHKSLVMLYIKPIVHDCASRTLRALMNPRTRCTLVEWGDGEYAQSLFWQRLHDTLLPTSDSDMLLYRLAPCTHRPLLLSE